MLSYVFRYKESTETIIFTLSMQEIIILAATEAAKCSKGANAKIDAKLNYLLIGVYHVYFDFMEHLNIHILHKHCNKKSYTTEYSMHNHVTVGQHMPSSVVIRICILRLL